MALPEYHFWLILLVPSPDKGGVLDVDIAMPPHLTVWRTSSCGALHPLHIGAHRPAAHHPAAHIILHRGAAVARGRQFANSTHSDMIIENRFAAARFARAQNRHWLQQTDKSYGAVLREL
ncbi:unnamed protein product [Pleuronectes platessa]|uniref:Uncharacterized protein n=1 Tax=Pleuronectes platessa TaxID=8262 RepID=A0A9N7UEL9_PLEPL|nr:unnamed protein product [Pleuronectes platessa]